MLLLTGSAPFPAQAANAGAAGQSFVVQGSRLSPVTIPIPSAPQLALWSQRGEEAVSTRGTLLQLRLLLGLQRPTKNTPKYTKVRLKGLKGMPLAHLWLKGPSPLRAPRGAAQELEQGARSPPGGLAQRILPAVAGGERERKRGHARRWGLACTTTTSSSSQQDAPRAPPLLLGAGECAPSLPRPQDPSPRPRPLRPGAPPPLLFPSQPDDAPQPRTPGVGPAPLPLCTPSPLPGPGPAPGPFRGGGRPCALSVLLTPLCTLGAAPGARHEALLCGPGKSEVSRGGSLDLHPEHKAGTR